MYLATIGEQLRSIAKQSLDRQGVQIAQDVRQTLQAHGRQAAQSKVSTTSEDRWG